jgi:hypothetical protein
LLDGKPGALEFVGRGEVQEFALDADTAADLVAEAVAEAKGLGLPWPEAPLVLEPSADLRRLVVESRALAMAASRVE